MTLEEKAAQMVGIWNDKADTLLDEDGNFDLDKAEISFKDKNGLGQVGRPGESGGGKRAREMAELTNAIQNFFMEHSRLGIPVFFHEECLHGLAEPEATSYPQPIALAGTFNPALVERLYKMTAEEARLRGAHQALTPVLDVARDPRWGRVEETFGEDPYLVGEMGKAAVRGFQGDGTFQNKKHLVATLKHFAAHSQPESGMNCAPVNVSERVLREVFLYPFKEAITKTKALSIMASYNEVDAIPSHANSWLLKQILRDEWGFDGFVVSDYYAIQELYFREDAHGHFVAGDKKEAAKLAVNAGVNLELPEPDCYKNISELVQSKALLEQQLDELVAPMLELKFRMGLFDDPFVDPDLAEQVSGSEENSQLALNAARESITLLKNSDNVLPLNAQQIKTIAVIGPNANRSLLGGYSGKPDREITVLDGIREHVGNQTEVLFSEGCRITVGGSWNEDEVTLPDTEEEKKLIAEAVEVAEKADVIVLAVGGNEQTSRESWSIIHLGDRTNLEMIGMQEELIKAVSATGKPVVALLFNGRPLSVNVLYEEVSGLLECWYLGQETGKAVAEVLFGAVAPSGKLPVSFPRSAGHIPCYYNHKPSARRGYLFDDVSPLFSFGFGLSYTQFKLSKFRLHSDTIQRNESTRVEVDVSNIGNYEGSEVIQMYIRDLVSSVTRPVKELKGFKKITLKPGEQQTVQLEISPESLAFYDINMEYTVEPGDFEIMVGTSSRDEDLEKLTLHVT